ncbi:uncharacterized protein LOC142171671 [Nicotiana tabacum]|uniref:Uncharacterized protein LOC142171671 n=1 Tax=Nicotiana tabacum TaxID=4097 RepID=A0AC58T2L1_TOBAC
MVYGFNDPTLRSGLWRDIRMIANQMIGAWEIMGDFNSILSQEDRVGSKGRVLSRIDRVITNNDWVNKFPASKVHYMPAGVYDHSPAMIKWEGMGALKMRIFRYYNMWSMDNSFIARVELNKDKFAEVEKREDESMKKLVECQEKIQKDPRNETLGKEEKEVTKQYIYWKEAKLNNLQKMSKVQWLKYGDMNTSYFHSVIKAKRAASRIFTIQNMQGEIVQSTDAVVDAFKEFYTSLPGTDKQNKDHVASHIVKEGQIVSEEQRNQR